ncbi:Ribosomal protein S12 methylthiotransferase RimO [uncultured Clostridium sp.]|nr:Ribosomal protein S12 methylthiotransferase RimO [uncultured Clostridium sp.]
MKIRVGMIALGCNKNRVDAEVMLGILEQKGYALTNDPSRAQVIIVNTCGFIGPAKEEAIETILEMAQYKQEGELKALIVSGCLAQRYPEDLYRDIPEIDAVIGITDEANIAKVIEAVLARKRVLQVAAPGLPAEETARVLTTPPYMAYLKIADGCDNCCSYCAIPMIRGPYHSRKMEVLIAEAKRLAQKGVKELVLVAQDTTLYGEDLYGSPKLPELLEAVCAIEGIQWVRVLYTYPERITEALIQTMERNEKICRYIDMPIQHIDDAVLARMNRNGTGAQIKALAKDLRRRGFTLRTTLITGFPGEDEAAFEALREFIKSCPFDRLGVFPYSQEEGTLAADMPDQVEEELRKTRCDELMQLQQRISKELLTRRIGQVEEVLIEGYDLRAKAYLGRSRAEAPEIDGQILVHADTDLAVGAFVPVRITQAFDYDLEGVALT